MPKKKAQQGTPALRALVSGGVWHRPHPYDHDPASTAYGLEAAEALGVAAERIFKTLVADLEGTLVVAVVPVSGNLDLKALAKARRAKRAVLADPADAERVTGYVIGGISPLGQRRQLPTVVDETALALDTVYVSAGRRGLQVELAPADLVRLTSATTAPIATSS